jgi:hypothetical protein
VGCDALTIKGDVLFEKNVKIRGSVIIENTQPTQAIISQGAVIDHDLYL